MSNTPTSQHSEVIFNFPIDRAPSRQRRISPHNSPGKNRPTHTGKRDVSPPPSAGPSKPRTPRKRASAAVTAAERERLHSEDEGQDDVMSAALAAVASSRRNGSPGESDTLGSVSRRGLSRNPLPLEFCEQNGREFDSRETERAAPYTPHRPRDSSRHRRSPSPSTRASSSQLYPPLTNTNTNGQYSPRRQGVPGKTSTVRELTRRHQTRWLSEDLSAPGYDDIEDNFNAPSRSTTSQAHYSVGRRPTARAGSDEPLTPGRSLLGEGLRAAGIGVARRRDPATSEDLFGSNHASVHTSPVRRTRSTGANSVIQDGTEWESPAQLVPSSRIGDLPGRRVADYRTPDTRRTGERISTPATSYARPGTSMAALHHDTSSTAPSRATPANRRSAASTSGPFRENPAEHSRLMLEALNVFESQLSRLPPMGQTTTSTIPEVFQSSQLLVHGLDRLQSSLKAASIKSLEAQVEAEIADGDSAIAEVAEVWAQVGADHRDHVRTNDEIIRTMTQFLLGVSKIMRDATTPGALQHTRSVSLDEDIGRRLAPEVTPAVSDKRSSNGRLSRESRRSWEPREAAQAINRIGSMDSTSNSTGSRASSAQLPPRSSAASSSEGISPSEGPVDQTPSRQLSSALSSVSSRRLYTPRDRIPPGSTRTPAMMSSLDSQETVHAYEPSPTPASRWPQAGRTRALPPIAIPPSLSTLPSESLLANSSSTPAMERNRRKVSSSSNITIRAEPSLPLVIKPPNTTTALTTTNVDVMEPASSMSRSDSGNSVQSNGVTFSKPPSTSSSTLNSLRRHDASNSRARSISAQLKEELRSPMSGSETERPRTFGVRGRSSLDGPRADSLGKSSQASTLTSRRERRRTITEIFAQADH
ncbi:hypothetical protein PHLGIDRAFT_125696 [Phlebiopsis gigantea 11061_1 CR5-6]|uniref:Uncharacterized protein n=1 Tax=Phlebiopsis gigantea (strain 11061_1 CR5-6) TaxID=745531 RepID=A0A0C3NXP2_PHLG1|nr:hypothetical protein PHLGIDRAFT_125696 [Phlebiopsis gigantea 11061_1 CR5-6]